MEYTIFKYGQTFLITSTPFDDNEYIKMEEMCGNPWTSKLTIEEALEYIRTF